MAVILRKKIAFGDRELDTRVIEPSGILSKEDRERAEELDEFLQSRIPDIAKEVDDQVPDDTDVVRRRHLLGTKLREIAQNRELVLQSDVDNMLIWQAIWQYLPESMIPERTNVDKPYSDKQHKRQDHLSLCYELGKYPWEEISWIQRWADVHEITARPSLLRDKRIFISLGKNISALAEYPTLTKFREIMKNLAKEFPTKQYRDTSLLPDEEISARVSAAVAKGT